MEIKACPNCGVIVQLMRSGECPACRTTCAKENIEPEVAQAVVPINRRDVSRSSDSAVSWRDHTDRFLVGLLKTLFGLAILGGCRWISSSSRHPRPALAPISSQVDDRRPTSKEDIDQRLEHAAELVDRFHFRSGMSDADKSTMHLLLKQRRRLEEELTQETKSLKQEPISPDHFFRPRIPSDVDEVTRKELLVEIERSRKFDELSWKEAVKSVRVINQPIQDRIDAKHRRMNEIEVQISSIISRFP